VIASVKVVMRLLADLLVLVVLMLRPRRAIAAEALVLRRQLALFQERGIKPRRVDSATRISLALLSRLCDYCAPRPDSEADRRSAEPAVH
jgi:hypothetical protein